jgi:hypothetical protein
MTLPTLIGFTGHAGCGKTTAADWALRNHKNCLKMSFASPLKAAAREIISSVRPKDHPTTAAEYLTNRDLKETPIPFLANITPRRLMQTLGTEWGRNAIHPDFWVIILAQKIERLLGHSYRQGTIRLQAVIDDVRFENEAEMIRAYGGTIVHVERPGLTAVEAHASEALDFEADYTFVNGGTKEDMEHWMMQTFPPAEST